MSFLSPANIVPRQAIPDREMSLWVKMWDPPNVNPNTRELINIAALGNGPGNGNRWNPVPEVMAAAGLQAAPATPHTVNRELMHGTVQRTWDGLKNLTFFTIGDSRNPTAAAGTFPAPTVRVPRGVVYHADTIGSGPAPHTIHWHGIEPTPMNDGVGHCSMEIGVYTYQWQPNFIGTYFYHCHRNTVQHFEFGLAGIMPIMAPDAYWGSIASIAGGAVTLNAAPIGRGRPEIGTGTPAAPQFPLGRLRTAANLSRVRQPNGTVVDMSAQFPGWQGGLLTDLDPMNPANPGGNNSLNLPAWMLFNTDPHAMTVPYDFEAIWVPDDRDSIWSDLAPSPFATFPHHGAQPGVNDQFQQNPGTSGFFAFNDFNADYWFITGVAVPAAKGGVGTIAPGLILPAALNSGVPGTQISIEAQVGQTFFIRMLTASYNSLEVILPEDAVIIEWDGRAMGVPPYGMNDAYLVPKGTPIVSTTARRFGALIKATTPMNDFATIKFIDTRGQDTPADPGADGLGRGLNETVVMTARIPFNIAPAPAGTGAITGTIAAAQAGVSVAITGPVVTTVPADPLTGAFTLTTLNPGTYTVTPNKPGMVFTPASAAVVVGAAGVPAGTFTAAAAPAGTFSISGPVFLAHTAVRVPGVQISLTGVTNAGSAVSSIAVSGIDGVYTFSGLAPGEYTLVASKTAERYVPVQRMVTITNADQFGQFFEEE